MAGAGRPTKLTPARREQLASLVRTGVPVETAALAPGIHRDSFFAWVRRGQDALVARDQGETVEARELPYLEFAEAIARARAEAEVEAVQIVNTAMERDWRAAAWLLERLSPARWGRRAHADVDVVHHQATALEGQIRAGHQIRLRAEARLRHDLSSAVELEEAEVVDDRDE
jgi:transposase